MQNNNISEIHFDIQSINSSNNYDSLQEEGNISFQQNYNENIETKIEDNESDNNNSQIDHKIICEECYKFPKIYLNNEKYLINLECDCKEYKNIDWKYFKKNFVKDERKYSFNNLSDKIKFDSYCQCDEHLEETYTYFCEDCEINLCRKCYTEKKQHDNHTIIDFNGNELKKKITEIYKKLQIKEIDKSLSFSSENKKKYNDYLKIFIEILKAYEKYPCYNLYVCINNIYDFLQKDIKKKEFQFFGPEDMKEDKKEELFKIKLTRVLKNIIEKNKDGSSIKEIRINKNNFKCLNILSNQYFKNLILLQLSNNNIKDLTPLLTSNFPVLTELNLSMNRIDDENANKIFKFDMPNLCFLNLYYNNLKKYDIFKNIYKLKKLRKLFVGLNKFKKEISEIDENTIYDLSTIEEIGFTKGVFYDESIDLISKFKFENLKILYLSCNNLSSLSFVDKLNCQLKS